jgi:peptide subunit release factor RF-3
MAASQDIDCGFTNGARFVLIKRTDAAGDWMYFDTLRGISVNDSPMIEA